MKGKKVEEVRMRVETLFEKKFKIERERVCECFEFVVLFNYFSFL
jgi:hypothetical protein